METFDIVTVGHFSIDQIYSLDSSIPKRMLGGSPAYVSLAARKFDVKVGVISKVGKDFPKAFVKLLHKNGVDLFGVKVAKNSFTTSYKLKYRNEKRQLFLRNRAPPILFHDLPSAFKTEIIHIAPIAGEITRKVIEELCKKANILSLDPQGFLRKFNKNGKTSLRKWADRRILGQIDIFKSSWHEARAVTGLKSLKASMKEIGNFGIKIIIVTLGKRGAMILFDDRFYKVPSTKPNKLIDPTGAGDVFMGAFLAEYIHRKDPVWCACIGSAAASFKVESVGPLLLAERARIYRCAEHLYAKCM